MKNKFIFLILGMILLLNFASSSINSGGDTVSTVMPSNTIEGFLIYQQTSPTVSIIAPINDTYFVNTSVPLTYSVIGKGIDTIWYNLDLGNNITIISPTFLNTTEGSHKLYLYANNSIGTSQKSVTFFVNSTKFKIIASDFEGSQKGSSTNFSILSYEEIQNLNNIVLENTNYGKIMFNQNINITADANFSNNQINLSNGINISFNRIEINSTILPSFNKPAILSLYGLTFSNPRVLINGELCPSVICKNKNYSGGTLRFNVTQFSVYSAEETPIPSNVTIIIGGSGGSGGGGGGGGIVQYLFPKVTSFSADISEIKISTTTGKVETEKLIITNNLNQTISLSLSQQNLGDFLTLPENKLVLAPKESKQISLDFIIRQDTVPDSYLGKIFIKNDDNNEQTEILTILEVNSEGALLDVNTEILTEYSKVPPGKDVITKITLFNLAPVSSKRDIAINYIVKDESGEKIVEEKETVAIETQTGFVRKITIPQGTAYGKYILSVTAVTSDGKVASASDTFEVVAPETAKIYILIITLAIIMGGIVIYFSIIKGGRAAGEMIRKLNLQDIVGGNRE